jgi:hypothetical protein
VPWPVYNACICMKRESENGTFEMCACASLPSEAELYTTICFLRSMNLPNKTPQANQAYSCINSLGMK